MEVPQAIELLGGFSFPMKVLTLILTFSNDRKHDYNLHYTLHNYMNTDD